MIIRKKYMASQIGQSSKKFPGLLVKPSKQLLAKSLEIAEFPLSADEHDSEGPLKISKAVKPEKMQNSRTKFVKQAVPSRQSPSEGYRCISDGGAAIGKCVISKISRKNAVHVGVKHPVVRASYKHTTDNSNTSIKNNPTVTSNAIQTSTSKEASNDNDYVNHSPANVIPPPERGVLLPNENTNLPISQTVKAVVKIDGLSMTIDVPPHQQDDVLNAVKDLHKADKDGLHMRKLRSKHGSRYKWNYKIYYGNKYLGFLSVEPLKRTDRFLRLDFNPSKIRRSGCKIVAQAMRSIIGANAAEIFNAASITRLDIAVDLYGIDINNLLYFSARPIDSSTWGKIFKHGKEMRYMLETQYIGASGSDHYFSVYDKRAERISKSGGKDDPGHEIVRVELRIKPRQIKDSSSNGKCSVQFDNLDSIDNLFQKLCITEIPVPNKDDGHFALFVYAAQHVGAHTALAQVKNSRKRNEYRNHLVGQAARCWKPDEYWARAIIAVRKALASIS